MTQATWDDIARFVEEKPGDACLNWERCGNRVLTSRRRVKQGRSKVEVTRQMKICDECTDRARETDRGWQERGYEHYHEWLADKLG